MGGSFYDDDVVVEGFFLRVHLVYDRRLFGSSLHDGSTYPTAEFQALSLSCIVHPAIHNVIIFLN